MPIQLLAGVGSAQQHIFGQADAQIE